MNLKLLSRKTIFKFIFLIFIYVLSISVFLFSCSVKNYTIKNDIKKKIQFTISQGDSYFNSYQLDKALETYRLALEKIYLLNDLENEIIVNLKITQIYILKNDYDNSTSQMNLCTSLLQYYSNNKVYFYYYQVYALYQSYNNKYDNALNYYKKSLEYTKDKKLIANIYNKIAKVYIKLQEYNNAKKYLNDAIKINKSKKYYDGLGDSYYNLGMIEFYNKNYNTALNFLNLALENDKINENIFGIYSDLNLIAEIYKMKGEYEKAKFYLEECLKLAKATKNSVLIKNIKEKLKNLEKYLNQ